MKKRLLVFLVALAGALVLWSQWQPGVRATEALEREYTLAFDPTVEILTARVTSQTSLTYWVYRLYPDGRLNLQYISAVDSKVEKEREMMLSDADMTGLIGRLVEAGFIEHDHEAWSMQERQGMSSHGGAIQIDLHLDRYRTSPGEEWIEASKNVVVRNPSSLARRFPGVPVFQAVAELGMKLSAYARSMEEKANG